MLARLFGNRATPILYGERVILRPPQRGDYTSWARLREESSAFLQPWEPTWGDNELSRESFRERRLRARTDADAGTGFVFFIFTRDTNRLAGGITLGSIRYGVARCGQIGYWMGATFAGKGLMQDAVKTLSAFGFERIKLHRLEAACIPSNERSVKVLEKTGFTCEGLLKSYLKINGEWQDHLLFACISGLRE
jgi:[ribosomal protein S5]-alanine N-acetyltransferase